MLKNIFIAYANYVTKVGIFFEIRNISFYERTEKNHKNSKKSKPGQKRV